MSTPEEKYLETCFQLISDKCDWHERDFKSLTEEEIGLIVNFIKNSAEADYISILMLMGLNYGIDVSKLDGNDIREIYSLMNQIKNKN